MHGKGIYTWKDGRKYEGEYFNDKKNVFKNFLFILFLFLFFFNYVLFLFFFVFLFFIFLIIINRVMVFIYGLMVENMMVNGKMENKMEKENI
jgi:hypothetical protein